MANTFFKIASVTVGSGGASTMSFASIPSTYTDLCLKISSRSTDAGYGYQWVTLSVNSGTATSSQKHLYGEGTSVGSFSTTSSQTTVSSTATSIFSSNEIYIPNYAGSQNKSFSVDSVAEINSSTQNFLDFNSGIISTSSAISQITLTSGTGNFAEYTTATLYGISNT